MYFIHIFPGKNIHTNSDIMIIYVVTKHKFIMFKFKIRKSINGFKRNFNHMLKKHVLYRFKIDLRIEAFCIFVETMKIVY